MVVDFVRDSLAQLGYCFESVRCTPGMLLGWMGQVDSNEIASNPTVFRHLFDQHVDLVPVLVYRYDLDGRGGTGSAHFLMVDTRARSYIGRFMDSTVIGLVACAGYGD